MIELTSFQRGLKREYSVSVTQGDAALPLTGGALIRMIWKYNYEDEAESAKLDITAAITDPDQGKAKFVFETSHTASLKARDYDYVVTLYDSAGQPVYSSLGKVRVW